MEISFGTGAISRGFGPLETAAPIISGSKTLNKIHGREIIYLAAGHWFQGSNITRFRLTDGDIIWSNVYSVPWGSFHHPFGMVIKQNEIISFNKISSHVLAVFRLNKNTGDTLSQKLLQIIDPTNFDVGFVTTEGVTQLNNGHYAIYGRLLRYYLGLLVLQSHCTRPGCGNWMRISTLYAPMPTAAMWKATVTI
jgi:hypothetical protein